MLYFDIFCRVVDNYGDIGVCWRLARQLANPPYQSTVRLWVDDLASFSKIEPSLQQNTHQQYLHQVEIRQWHEDATSYPPLHEVVIEAFACELPSMVRDHINAEHIWINLEYLSAESWVENFHACPSPQQQGQSKFFYFPGFTEYTGGLLREADLAERQQQWLIEPTHAERVWTSMHVPAHIRTELHRGERQQIVLFHYPNAPVDALLTALKQSTQKRIVLSPHAFSPAQRALENEQLILHHFDFVSQDDFDLLLSLSMLNLVRGEDSLVRALWAAKPFIWQPYIQAENLHLDKLQALLELSPLTALQQHLLHYWSTGEEQNFTTLLLTCLQPENWSEWCRLAKLWRSQLTQQSDLCTRLISFCTQRLRTS